MFTQVLHTISGIVTSDYPRPPIKGEPSKRLIWRLCISVIAIAVLIYAMALVYQTVPQLETRTVRHFKKSYFNRDFTNETNIHCPCRLKNIRIRDFVDIWAMNINGSTMFIDDAFRAPFCNQVWSPDTVAACPDTLWYCCAIDGNSVLPSPAMLMPEVLARNLFDFLQKSCTDQVRFNKLMLYALNPTNRKEEYQSQDPLARSLWSMIYGFIRDPTNTDDGYFWSAPKSFYTSDTLTLLQKNWAFKMQLYWRTYIDLCDPPYCDEVNVLTRWHRFYISTAQLGGLFVVILMIIRNIFWPTLTGFLPPESSGNTYQTSRSQTPISRSQTPNMATNPTYNTQTEAQRKRSGMLVEG